MMRVQWGPVLVISAIAISIYAVLVFLQGCHPKPPGRFMNGDETAIGPATHGEVVEPDMAKPEN